TGDGGGVSNARLVLDLERAQRGEQLLDEVVLLVVQRRPAQAGDAEGTVQRPALVVDVLPGLVAGRDDPIGDHVERDVEVEILPVRAVRPAVTYLGLPQRAGHQALARRPLGAQPAARDRTVRVALDLADLAILDVHLLAAADRTVRADRAGHRIGRLGAGGEVSGPFGLDRRTPGQRVGTGELAVDGPVLDPVLDPGPHTHAPSLPRPGSQKHDHRHDFPEPYSPRCPIG